MPPMVITTSNSISEKPFTARLENRTFVMPIPARIDHTYAVG
jgi:hypothetical protein